MIVVAGSPTEGPVELLVAAAEELGLDVLVLEEERAAEWQLEVEARGGDISAWVTQQGRRVELSAATGLYLRLTAPDNYNGIV